MDRKKLIPLPLLFKRGLKTIVSNSKHAYDK